jgi:hypothetical protein
MSPGLSGLATPFLEARGVSRGNVGRLPVKRRVFPQLTLFDVARPVVPRQKAGLREKAGFLYDQIVWMFSPAAKETPP